MEHQLRTDFLALLRATHYAIAVVSGKQLPKVRIHQIIQSKVTQVQERVILIVTGLLRPIHDSDAAIRA